MNPLQPLSDAELDRLIKFEGYGDVMARLWFLGMEERGADLRKLPIRANFETIEDLRTAHERLGITKFHRARRPAIQRTWRGMCHIVLGLMGIKPTRPEVRKYQAERLGRIDGETFLSELLPLPRGKFRSWDFGELIPQYESATQYIENVQPRRIEMLKGLLSKNDQAQVVVAYGHHFWNQYAQLLDGEERPALDPSVRVISSDNKLLVLCHHFSARTMNRGCEHVVSSIQAYQKDIGFSVL